jgi:predicted O-methyltransferase YrrM
MLCLRYWLEAQPMSLLSEPEKRDHIRSWQNTTGYRIFIETGTYLGETTLAMADVFDHCYTIEYDRSLYDRANVIFSDRKNITLYHGDSGKLLGSILTI